MSWFTEIAGKAEDLLNKVDQTAATALQNKGKHPSPSSSSSYLEQGGAVSDSSYLSSRVFPGPSRLSSAKSEPRTLYSPGTLTVKAKPESDDEKLLQFLNASDTVPTPARKVKPKGNSPEKKHSLSVNSAPKVTDDTNAEKVESVKSPDASIPSPIQTPIEQDARPRPEDTNSFPIGSKSEDPNNLTNEELLHAENRSKHAEAEMKRMQKKLEHWNSQISGSDKAVRELRERERDMLAAMDAKDSQLAILKVRLQEADQELQVKRNLVNDLQEENERMIKEHAQSAAFQNKTVEVLQEQVQQTERELNKVKDSFLQNQNDHMLKIGKMEEEHRHLVDSYSSLQKKWTDLNDRNKEFTLQLKQSHSNFEALQQEYNDYKQKAQRILQSKEKLISSLKGGNLEADSIEKSEAASALLNAEVEGMRQERDLIRDELRSANELVETYRAEIRDLEKSSQNDIMVALEQYEKLKEQLSAENTQKEELQNLNTQLKEELQFYRDDLTRTKSNYQSRIQDREIEIEKLRRQLTAKSLSTVSQEELESRLHALTENLIQKQTIVESLSTEKNSLVLQLERLEQQLREAQNYGLQQHAFVGMNNSDAERKSKTVFLDNPFDSPLTRKVKRVYGSIDALSIRLGLFFRRYPISRVFVFIYMLLLHFWVMIVLLTYEPEIHNASYEVSKNP